MKRAIAFGMWKGAFPPLGIDIPGPKGEVEDTDEGEVVSDVD